METKFKKYQNMKAEQLVKEKEILKANVLGHCCEIFSEVLGYSNHRGKPTNFALARANLCDIYLNDLEIIEGVLSAGGGI